MARPAHHQIEMMSGEKQKDGTHAVLVGRLVLPRGIARIVILRPSFLPGPGMPSIAGRVRGIGNTLLSAFTLSIRIIGRSTVSSG